MSKTGFTNKYSQSLTYTMLSLFVAGRDTVFTPLPPPPPAQVRTRDTAAPIGAFMWPLHWSMWLGIFVSLHVTAVFLTLYEWHSPFGMTPRGRNRDRVFSFSSALNVCYAILFGRTVAIKTPKCWTGRLLMNLWAIFCLFCLSTYTANLAAVMVGEKTYEQLSGIHDPKVQKNCSLDYFTSKIS